MDHKKINKEIRSPEIRLIDSQGNMKGIVSTQEALRAAYYEDLDLIEISPNADPPVCKIGDYGKMRYELMKKESEEKKKNKRLPSKEVKFNMGIAEHDYQVKINHIRKFIEYGNSVKVVCQARGRNKAHSKEYMPQFSEKIIDATSDIALLNGKIEMKDSSYDFSLIPKASKQKT